MKKISDTDDVRLVKLLCAQDMYDEYLHGLVACPFSAWLKREIEKIEGKDKK